MFKTRILLTLFLLLTIKVSISQEINFIKIDIIISKYNDSDAAVLKSDVDFLKERAFQIQNKGFLLQENEFDFSGSLVYINQSLKIWEVLKDTLNTANLKKYKGLLLANLNDFGSSKKEIQEAIELFQVKGNQAGTSVSFLDLSKTYTLENKLDSAIYYAEISKEYWEKSSDTSRIISVNNQMIKIYLEMDNSIMANQIFEETLSYTFKKNLHWRNLLDFYFLAYKLFERENSNPKKSQYYNFYFDLIKSLKERGIQTKSQFDI